MKPPEKAVVLAAGLGTRMIPLSLDKPKPMMLLWGKPVLGHILDTLQRWGVKQALVNVHNQPDAFIQYLRKQSSGKLRINLSFEPEILGTGGILRRAQWFLDDNPFWMINGDVVFDVNHDPFLKAFSNRRSLSVLWLHPNLGPRTVEMKNNVITNFQSSRPGTQGTYTFCGLHLLSPEILNYIAETGFSTIIQAYTGAMAEGRRITGICVTDSFWADIGTPDSYLNAHNDVLKRFQARGPGWRLFDPAQLKQAAKLRKRNIRLTGFVSLGSNVVIEKGAVISNSVIWDGARIASGAVVENAIIGTHTHVSGRVPRTAIRSGCFTGQKCYPFDNALSIALTKLEWDPEKTTVIPFDPRGSARVFTRLEFAGQRLIMIRYSLERKENALYARHARFLRGIGVPVPAVILDIPAERMTVIEDIGDLCLQDVKEKCSRQRLTCYYQKAVAAALTLHEQGTIAAKRTRLRMVAGFSADLYQWEHEFFARHFLRPYLKLSSSGIRAIMDELTDVGAQLLKTPYVLIHRDLQSSNIMLVKGQPYFIDFQGMRYGSAAYDLASLLCDPYVELPIEIQEKLLQHYNGLASGNKVAGDIFRLAAIERLAQALGAYGRLSESMDTAWFEKYIPAGLRMMQRSLQQVDRYPRTQAAIRKVATKSTP